MALYPIVNKKAYILCIITSLLSTILGRASTDSILAPVVISSNWKLQDAAKVQESGDILSQLSTKTKGWLDATVPGTVLTSLVNDGIYPEPLYGENNRPDKIPESLSRTDWWYRTTFTVPDEFAGKKIWLNFDGINYAAEIWVNGHQVGSIKGAFLRGVFDVSAFVTAGKSAALAVRISPQPNPGVPHEKTQSQGTGKNGGVTAMDGATFLCSIGWDWIPGIRDRETGIWQKVFLTATGPAVIKNPLITTDLPLPRTDSADVTIQATVQNVTDQPVKGELVGSFDDISVQQPVELAANSSQVVNFDPKAFPQLHLLNPKLWWPNGFGEPNLHVLRLALKTDGKLSDAQDITFGIRKIAYSVPNSDNLNLVVNGVPVFAKGGDWGMDEAMKRSPRERLEAQVRMHQIANYTIIRNWVGQSTNPDFYDLCDKYGILVWDEFFQPNPSDGPNPTDLDTYMANVRDKMLRFRNHACVALWCARNEGNAPEEIDTRLRAVMSELDPARLYQGSSTNGRGVHSGGPYYWRTPQEYYVFPATEAFKTEIGSVSIPTIESIQGMMPGKDWNVINDDWAEHDMTHGAQEHEPYIHSLEYRYGKAANLADFVRKGQMMNYEAFRAMYEGREAKLFNPETGDITWMSNPAQPSFVWQLYHHDLEPNSSLFAVRKACEPVHLQLNEKEWTLQVINNLPMPITGAKAHLVIYNLDGSSPYQNDIAVNAAPSAATDLGPVAWPANLSAVHFIKLELRDAAGKLLSDNFYWRPDPAKPGDLTALDQLPPVTLETKTVRHDEGDKFLLDVTLRNPAPTVALMAHLQLRRAGDKKRVLPVYYTDNYVSLAPKEEKTVTIEAAKKDLQGESPLVLVDGWNIGGVKADAKSDASVALNENAQVDHWPKKGMTSDYGVAKSEYHVNCGGGDVGPFKSDAAFSTGPDITITDKIDTSVPHAAPEKVYQSFQLKRNWYLFVMKPVAPDKGYTVRLHFVEPTYTEPGKRWFDVSINGKQVLNNFDIFQAAGAKDKAVVKDFPNVVPDEYGNITVECDPPVGPNPIPEARMMPLICGIEVLPQ